VSLTFLLNIVTIDEFISIKLRKTVAILKFAADVFANCVFAGPHPAFYGIEPSTFEELHTLGIRTILSLERKNCPLIAEKWSTYGQDYKHITSNQVGSFFIEDFEAPSMSVLDAIVDTVLESVNNKQPIYIHCRGGYGRTGTILAALLMKKRDYEPTQALYFVRSYYSRRAVESPEQEACLTEYANYLKPQQENMPSSEDPGYSVSLSP
jgi:protein-tyrosine phosphatase